MPEKRIIQLVAGFSDADAISNEARVLRSLFRQWGYSSDIVCEDGRVLPELRQETITPDAYASIASADDIVLLHFSIGSPMSDFYVHLPGHKALLYHNITPAKYLRGIHQGLAADLEHGREQLTMVVGNTEVLMACSQFNAKELCADSQQVVHILPLVLDWSSLHRDVDVSALQAWRDGQKNILFVGRCVPHKKIEDLLFSFHFYQKYIEPEARLIHIGSSAGTEKYFYWLQALVRKNSIRHVEFPGMVNQSTLNAAFDTADLFLCMSEHEGFCIPLIEAMEHDIPVMAYAAGAVPETLDGAGILVKQKRYDLIAEMMSRVLTDTDLRTRILEGQRARLNRYKNENVEEKIRTYLTPLLTC